jgi:hypothetical protein
MEQHAGHVPWHLWASWWWSTVGYKNSVRKDLTEGQQNTLAPETIDTLEKLPQPVEALAFYSQRAASQSESAKNLLEQYKFEGKDKFNYRFIDPEADPLAARDAKITRDGMGWLKQTARTVELRPKRDHCPGAPDRERDARGVFPDRARGARS